MYLNDYRNICAVCPSIGNAKELKECLRLTWSEGSCYFHLITACKELCEGYVFTHVCHSVHGGGCIPACLAGLWGVCIPACFAGFQAHIQGGAWGSGQGGSPGLHTVGKLRVWPRGSPGPHPGGCIPACTEADPPS